MNIERNKQHQGISIICTSQGNKKNLVRALRFATGEVIYKRVFDNKQSALNMYESLMIDKESKSGIRGRYDYLDDALNA